MTRDRGKYAAALALVGEIDEQLTAGGHSYRCTARRHYRRASDGALLWTLDQVVSAILDNDLDENKKMAEVSPSGHQ